MCIFLILGLCCILGAIGLCIVTPWFYFGAIRPMVKDKDLDTKEARTFKRNLYVATAYAAGGKPNEETLKKMDEEGKKKDKEQRKKDRAEVAKLAAKDKSAKEGGDEEETAGLMKKDM